MRPSRFFGLAKILSGLVFAALYIPLVSIFFLSLYSPDPTTTGSLLFGMDGYTHLTSDPSLLASLWISLYVAVISTAASTVLGTLLAYALDRYDFAGKTIFETLGIAPLVLPELVLGIAFLIWFILLRMTLGQFSIVLAHISFTFSYVFITVQTRLKEFDRSIEDAAYDLGANAIQVFFKILLPILAPAILAGAMMAFTISFDDFFITFFTAGVGSDTLPLKIYSMTKYGVSKEINALSTLVLAITFLLVFAIFNPFKKSSLSKARTL